MKKSKYQFFEEIQDGVFLHYSAMTNRFLLLSKKNHHLFEEGIESIPKGTKLYDEAIDSMFFVDDQMNETHILLETRKRWADGDSLYNIVINPTLDCNLSCWYCYENRIRGSKISSNILMGIKKNISAHYDNVKYDCLKLSFFGGEPFMEFSVIKELLEFADSFCKNNGIELIADFTTNATLITEKMVEFLSRFRCHFQITLDGNEPQHNKIKIDRINNINTYQKTLGVLRLIEANIPNRLIAVRINFDNRTLKGIDHIIDDISFLDNKFCYVILKKVWQLPTDKVDKKLLITAIEKLFDKKYLVDYYLMPKGSLCFAERRNQALINYDGGIYKCTTLCDFNKVNSLGEFNTVSGNIIWDEERIKNWFADMQRDYCKNCKWFPACMGICNRQLMAHPDEEICTFDACNLDSKEYLLYLFRYNLLYKEINKS